MAKKLFRSQQHKMISGVCGGLGKYFDIDVTLMRLIIVAIALITAILPTAIFYTIAWIIIPAEEEK